MKSILLALSIVACLALPSCEGPSIAKASKITDLALTAGVLFGDIKPDDARLAYELKTIVLDPAAAPADKGGAVVDLALTKAVDRGSIKPEEAALVREVGVVILEKPEPADIVDLVPASPDLSMGWQPMQRDSALDAIDGPDLTRHSPAQHSPLPFSFGLVAWSADY